jgi:hypothetical protein
MRRVLGALAVVAVITLGLSAASADRPASGGLPHGRLVAIARGAAAEFGDRHVSSALVVRTRKNEAENWLEPGAVPRSAANPRVYVIVLRGRFVCGICSAPPGAKLPRGRSAQIIWVPGKGVTDFGLTARMPRGLQRLGHVRRISWSAAPPRR